VSSTGVYCRPSCGARPALRRNVAFHASCVAAEQAGFRACLRCKPDQPPLAERHALAVAQACRLIDAAEEEPDLDSLAQACGMSRFHFHRIFKAHSGITPKAYAAAGRARRLQQGLAQAPSVTDAIYAAGFNSSGRFYAASDAVLGMSPKAFRATRIAPSEQAPIAKRIEAPLPPAPARHVESDPHQDAAPAPPAAPGPATAPTAASTAASTASPEQG
jgi:AraC family transcriptional regulator of adaptative response/methylated-DNA-[protein]-cysteine methyltransferase